MERKYDLYINGKISEEASNRLISFELTDNMGLKLDNLIIAINNGDKKLEIPNTNANIELVIRHNNELYKMGQFVVQYVDAGSSYIKINCVTKDFSNSRKKSSRVFKDKTLGAILKDIANELGLELKIDSNLQTKKVGYYMQDNASPLELLLDLSDLFYAIANIKDDKLIFVSKGQKKFVEFKEKEILAIQKAGDNNQLFKGVKYEGWNFKEGKIEELKKGQEPYAIIGKEVDDSIMEDFLEVKLKETLETSLINIGVQGNPEYQAGFHLEIKEGEYEEFKGTYRIESVRHEYINGYVSELKAVKIE